MFSGRVGAGVVVTGGSVTVEVGGGSCCCGKSGGGWGCSPLPSGVPAGGCRACCNCVCCGNCCCGKSGGGCQLWYLLLW